MSRLIFIIVAIFALLSSQDLLVVPGIKEPIYACLFALLLSPWIKRQFQ